MKLAFTIVVAAILSLVGLTAWAEGEMNPAALAKALPQATVTLDQALKASERQGQPISAKYEIEDGALQLSVYTIKDTAFSEVIVDHKAGGKSGTVEGGGVYRVGFPRTDLKVSVDGVVLRAGFALGGWVAFQPMDGQAMVMGDLVLTQDEATPVMRKLREGGIEITAVHNHLLRAEPMTLYMHIQGHGDPVALASAIHA